MGGEERRHEDDTGGKWRIPERQVEEEELTRSKEPTLECDDCR